MKKALLVFTMLLFAQYAHSEIVIDKLEDPEYLNGPKTSYNTYTPFHNTATTTKRTYNLNSGQLSKVERKVFGRTYVGDDATNRLQRLESSVFGAVQSGNERSRLTKLSSATQGYSNKYPQYSAYNGYNNYYNNGYYNNYYNPNNPYYNRYTPYRPYARPTIRNIIRNIRSGSLTGYTPPVNTYYNQYPQNSYYNFPPPNGYYTSTTGNGTQFTDLFSNGQSGSETYYDDGRYRKNLSSTSGGCGVKVIY